MRLRGSWGTEVRGWPSTISVLTRLAACESVSAKSKRKTDIVCACGNIKTDIVKRRNRAVWVQLCHHQLWLGQGVWVSGGRVGASRPAAGAPGPAHDPPEWGSGVAGGAHALHKQAHGLYLPACPLLHVWLFGLNQFFTTFRTTSLWASSSSLYFHFVCFLRLSRMAPVSSVFS